MAEYHDGKVCAIENKVHDIQNNHAGHYQDVLKKLEKMNKNLTRLLVMPVQQIRPKRVEDGGGGSNESEVVHPANLCSCPKNLYVLWAECNRAERGQVRFEYCCRTIVWDAVEALVQRGLTSDVAFDRIYSECGGPNTKVNDVIKELKHVRSIGNAALHMHVV